MRFLLAVLLFGSTVVHATTIEFESGTMSEFNELYQEQGFAFSGSLAMSTGAPSPRTDAIALLWQPGTVLTMERVGGGAFALNSFDYNAQLGPAVETNLLTVTGYLAGGGQIQTVLSGLAGSWLTPTFDSSWSNLLRVEIVDDQNAQPYLTGIEQLQASAVPIPAAVWLFGSALAGLGWMRRKQTV